MRPIRRGTALTVGLAMVLGGTTATTATAATAAPHRAGVRPAAASGAVSGWAATSATTTTTAPASASAATATVPGLGTFRVSAGLRRVPVERTPLLVGQLPLVTSAPRRGGIVRYRHRVTGRLHDHPVVQATHVMGWLESYRATHDRRYLDLATRNADHLLAEAVTSRDALWFPYRFDFALHGRTADTVKGPWYSAMAQGEVLAAFVRMYEVTGDARWRDAADRTYASFLRPRRAGVPWTVEVDRGALWFEEYADDARPDRAYNGHNFAAFGLYEYWRATGNPTAGLLVRGALATTAERAPLIRRPGELSRYCLTHDVRSASYHGIHVRQLAAAADITGDVAFSALADTFLDDAPASSAGGTGRIAHGTWTVLARDASGRVTRRSAIAPARASSVRFDARARIPGRSGIWLHIANGPSRGWWIQERPGIAFVTGQLDLITYSPARRALFDAGRHTAHRIPASGRRSVKVVRLERPSSAPVSRRVTIDGARYLRMAAGTFAGMYVPADSVHLR